MDDKSGGPSMLGKIDVSKIGQNMPIQDPAQAMGEAYGSYMDAVLSVPVEQRLGLDQMPQAPQPMPFVLRGAGKGGR